MKRSNISLVLVAVVTFVAGMIVVAAGGNLLGIGDLVSSNSQAEKRTVERLSPLDGLSFEEAFQVVAETVNPAVVQINSSKKVPRRGVDFFGSHPFFDEFFGRNRGNDDRDPQRDEFQLQQGLGSGVIIQSEGYIVTNRHVIDGADELEVHLFDGRVFEAEVVGSDELSDVAVVRIRTDEELPYIMVGDSDELRVGQWVLAFGSPLSQSLSNTVTTGIVSALGRFSRGDRIENFIQTDAAINPGNSGGPLVNLKGELVGINTAIYTQTGGYQGIGLAIPGNTAKNVADQLINEGRVSRGYLGIRFSPVSEALAKALNAPRGSAQVASVEEDGAAGKAGVKEGDVIVAIDGKELTNANELLTIVATAMPGDELELTVLRDEKRRTINVVLGERPEDLAAEAAPAESGSRGNNLEGIQSALGLTMRTLDSDLARRFNLDEDLKGVLLTDVDATSEAFTDADIREGDVVVELDKETVETVEDFARIYDSVDPGESFLVRIQRGNGSFLTALTKPAVD